MQIGGNHAAQKRKPNHASVKMSGQNQIRAPVHVRIEKLRAVRQKDLKIFFIRRPHKALNIFFCQLRNLSPTKKRIRELQTSDSNFLSGRIFHKNGGVLQERNTSGFQLVFIIFIQFRVQGLMQLPTALMIAVLIINRPFRGNSKKKIFRLLIIDKGMLSALLCHHVSSNQHGIYLRIAKRLYELFAPLSL